MKKTVCIITTSLSSGGAQRVVSILSQELARIYQLYTILNDGSSASYSHGGKLIDLKTPVEKSTIGKFLNFILRIIRLSRIKKKTKPSASISFLDNANFTNLLSRQFGKNIISVRNYRSIQLQGFYGTVYRFLIRALYNKSHIIITPSKGIKADLVSNFKVKEEKITVIYNPYNFDYISSEAEKDLDLEEYEIFKKPVLITVGSLSKQKGHSHLIRAFNEINKKIPNMHLVIIGEGELEQELKDLTKELGLPEKISFLGYKNNPFKYLARASIFCLPSLFEGFPNVLVEAMACGTPVIAADCSSGPREILAPETDFGYKTTNIEEAKCGVLTPVCSGGIIKASEPLTKEERLLAEAVINLYHDQGKYDCYKKQAYKRVADFRVEKIAKEWVELIEA